MVVTDGVTPYLRATLEALRRQTRHPDQITLVDVAPVADRDGLETLAAAIGLTDTAPLGVIEAPHAATLGAAIDAARSGVGGAGGDGGDGIDENAEWLWILHDDSAPAADALEHVLGGVREFRDVAVAGCKQRGWVHPDQLLEVGLTATRSARREADVDAEEIDQGQHDTRGDVLAVGTAGMLVRASVWDELGGLNPHLGPFGDGLEFCRRVRLAGHEVRVVPTAVVHHARAGLEGLRERQHSQHGQHGQHGQHDTAAHPHTPDRRRSFRARRIAQSYNALLAANGAIWPVYLLGLVLLGPLRALVRLLQKQPRLAGAEISAALSLLGLFGAVRDGRRRIAHTSVRPLSALASYETTGSRIRAQRRDARRHRRAVQGMRSAPSELEISERAALAATRRRWIAALCVLLGAAGVAVSGHLLGAFPSGGAIAALPATVGETWAAARSGWIAAGIGAAGPADPLLSVLTLLSLPLAVFGIQPSTTLVLILVAAPLAAGLGAWFAAGSATRRPVTRAWVALAWALCPTMLLALGEGRVGVALASAALPWVALSIAWVLGVRHRDLLLPGLVGARRRRRRPVPGVEQPPAEQRELTVFADLLDEGEAPHQLLTAAPARDDAIDESRYEVSLESFEAAPAHPGSRQNASISLMAGAGGGLALALATAGVPALLPAAVLVVALLCAVAPRGRARLLLLLLPALTLHLPVLVGALRNEGSGMWPALLADTGVPLATTAAPGHLAALGWPEDPWSLRTLQGAVTALLGADVAAFLPWAWATLIVLAVLALLPSGPAARATRAAWAVVVLGLVTHAVTTRVVTALGETAEGVGAAVAGWGGAGTLLVTAGLLAAVAIADGARYESRARDLALSRSASASARASEKTADGGSTAVSTDARTRTAGRRLAHATVVLVVGVLAAVPIAASAGYVAAGATAQERLLAPRGVVVPALSQQVAAGPERSRTLEISLADDTLSVGVWRGDGRLLTETSTLAAARQAAGAAGLGSDPLGDAAVTTAAQLAGGGGTDLAARLGDLGIGVVLVPPVGDGDGRASRATATVREHDDLVARLDGVPGLERVTVNPAGTVWRVVPTVGAAGSSTGISDRTATNTTASSEPADSVVSVARARITDSAGTPLQDLPAEQVDVHAQVPPAPGQERLVVLAERADAGWQATLDGEAGTVELDAQPLEDGRQAFALPGSGGTLTVTYGAPAHGLLGLVQVIVLGITTLLAIPVRRGGIDA